jgi:hypothetical protein
MNHIQLDHIYYSYESSEYISFQDGLFFINYQILQDSKVPLSNCDSKRSLNEKNIL